MYNKKKKFNTTASWLKRRIMIILTAFMLGMSNVIYEEDKLINENRNNIEQLQKDDEKE